MAKVMKEIVETKQGRSRTNRIRGTASTQNRLQRRLRWRTQQAREITLFDGASGSAVSNQPQHFRLNLEFELRPTQSLEKKKPARYLELAKRG